MLLNKLQRFHVLPNPLIPFYSQCLRLSQCCFENSLVEYYVMSIGKFSPTLRRLIMPSSAGSRSPLFRYRKVNGQDVLVHALRHIRGAAVELLSFLALALDAGEQFASSTGRFTDGEKPPAGYPLNRMPAVWGPQIV